MLWNLWGHFARCRLRGIKTTLKINSDTTYDLRSEYFGKKNDTFEESGIYNIMSQDIIELVTPSSGEKTYYKILDNAVPCLIVLEHSIMVNGRNIMFWKNNRNILIYILMKNWTHFMLKPILHLFWKTKLGFPGSLTTVWFMVRFSSTGMSLIDRMY